jgi:hypothetical protein
MAAVSAPDVNIETYRRAWEIGERVARQMGWPLGEVVGYGGPRIYDPAIDSYRRSMVIHDDPETAKSSYVDFAQCGDLIWAFWENRPPEGWASDEAAAMRDIVLLSRLLFQDGSLGLAFIAGRVRIDLALESATPFGEKQIGSPYVKRTGYIASTNVWIEATDEGLHVPEQSRNMAKAIDAVTDGAIQHALRHPELACGHPNMTTTLYGSWFGRESEVSP